MKKVILILISSIVLLSFCYTGIYAQDHPVQLALIHPIQIHPESDDITGVRLSLLYGKNGSVTGLDIGLVNHNLTGISQGIQYGLLGIIESDFQGWQDNFVNITKRNCTGLQLGVVNSAHSMNGIQIGIVNVAENMEGLQIGVINIIKHGGQFPFFPIVNWSF
jgi:hypothetical protein